MKIHVVGLGVAEQAILSEEAQSLLANLSAKDIVLGASRQHDTIAHYAHQAQRQALPKLTQLAELFGQWQTQGAEQVVVLASGDPLYYGIGAWLVRTFPFESLCFYPNVSSVQVACHRLGLSLQNVHVVSLHGRPLASLRRHLQSNKTLVLLTDQYSQPKQIAQECSMAGMDHSEITVCEALGYTHEKVRTFVAKEGLENDAMFDPLNVIVVKTSQQTSIYPSAPGIPDVSFITDKGEGKGMITKREVRLAVLSYMNINQDDTVWDIGAGCGGVSVELAYWHPHSRIIAIEHHAERLACLRANQERFGVVQNLSIVAGRAPDALVDLSLPNKVFIGGSDGELCVLLESVWSILPLGGTLTVSAVTEETKYQVMQFVLQRDLKQDANEQSVQLSISKGERLAGQRMFRPNLPVSLFHFSKLSGKVAPHYHHVLTESTNAFKENAQ
ncbi:precorrin-6y C5,15-methyltransferase (decarboxylating) subunit CbiE [Marinomonas spartinae]|uniref:precorrin-6y C5,15-methyltransferase (decarboxylating) subunit CbiE n=1 Tax=Marinomonas spartinae TaxID=1792290 RepID=UPI0018F26518|nr:precorrin-6y C5,15-methyltransferase (decarboxylating) subunit CbiE [Marinomonas spartinae]MBJ7553514.1 precorrin-6y C5,15-methyltransferase (decarboxylating) subunit CbiE [Marinomonas spartinae]